MFKAILKWLIKKIVNKDFIKNIIHKTNANLAKMVVDERKAVIASHAEACTGLVNSYLRAYGNDGQVDEVELAIINADCDLLVDRYISEEFLEKMIEESI